jgi:hypothetical protein
MMKKRVKNLKEHKHGDVISHQFYENESQCGKDS